MEKDFEKWHKVKVQLQQAKNLPTFNEREIWWCSVGRNIGYEILGKGEKFWRPVLILNKHNHLTFFGLPLTSTVKPESEYHHRLFFNDRDGSVLLQQGRIFSGYRLSNIMGKIPEPKFAEIMQAYKDSF